MARRRGAAKVAQAWVELAAADPEAVSALAVARSHLSAGRRLTGLRRIRMFELSGPLPGLRTLEKLLHRSIQFYNPHKERCTVRLTASEAPPVRDGERLVLVFDLDGERRRGAERWWQHETGKEIEVREAVVWALSFEPGANVGRRTAELALLRDRRHGLLCNPNSQAYSIAGDSIPLPWLRLPEAR